MSIPMTKTVDVLGLGYTAVDELLYVDAYPAADAKVPISRRERQCGGLTATALVAAARAGCRCAYAGTLGEDEHSAFVMERFLEEGIDTAHVRRHENARPVRATIIVGSDCQTRTIFYDLNGVAGPDSTWPPEDVIGNARALFIDHCGVAGMIRAAQIAHKLHIPVIADLENAEDPAFPELLSLVDHLVVSRDFALRISGQSDPAAAARALWLPGRRVSAVTCGRDGSWFVTDGDPGIPCHQPAPAVEVVDTTGCGDVFHGAYAAAVVRGMDIPAAMCFASVAAGLKATRRGGQAGIPRVSEIESYMRTAQFCDQPGNPSEPMNRQQESGETKREYR
jgi:sulfofructose kinase